MVKIKTYTRGNLHFASITVDGKVHKSMACPTKEWALGWVRLKVNVMDLPVAWCDTLQKFVTIPQD